jgi:ADP-ribose pyrophosphatase YjhB (NUDIX family)
MPQYTINFQLKDSDDTIAVPTGRPDWLFGTAFIGLSPAHALATAGGTAINPINGEPVPVIVDEAITDDPLLGVPAHDSLSRKIAAKHDIPYMPVIAQDFGEPLPGAKDVFGVVVIGYDPQTGKYMGLLNGDRAWLVGGGREPDETYDECARRELAEEAGYESVKAWIGLGDPIYSYYYNSIKDSNRRSLGYNYLGILDEGAAGEQRQESHEDFAVWWTGFDELYKNIEVTGGGSDHWLEALRRAKDAVAAYVAGRPYEPAPYTGEGVLINSASYDGMNSEDARGKIAADLQ